MDNQTYFRYGEEETSYLKSKDPILGEIIDKIGYIKRPIIPDLYEALLHSIVGQQISTKAQETVWKRLIESFQPIIPEHINEFYAEDLQKCGITMRKAEYIKEITKRILDGSLNLNNLKNKSDEEVCIELCNLSGIGVWTAEMLMTFSMQRPNIISYGDLAILRGLRMVYHHRKITPKLFAKYKRRYSPYATTASLYLWAVAGGAIEGMKDYAPKGKKVSKKTDNLK